MPENKQKIVEYLKAESSETAPLTTKNIILRLNSLGISCDRRTLYKDMEILIENGTSIYKTELGKENAYYYASESNFTLEETKILLRAVKTAKFITNNETERLVEKIISISGVQQKNMIQDDCNI